MRKKIEADEIKKDIQTLLDKYGCELISFEYYKKIFGNIVLKIKFKEEEIEFITDRGEIVCNGKYLCNYDYLITEKKTTPQKLLELIEWKLNSLQKEI